MGLRWKLALLPFRSAVLRVVVLRLSETLNRTGRWLGSSWRPALLLVLTAAFIWWARLALLAEEESPPLKSLLTSAAMVQVLGLTVLLALLRWALRTRRRIVIGAFQNFTGDERNNATIDKVVTEFGGQYAKDLELLATIIYTERETGGRLPINELAEVVHAIKPHFPIEQITGAVKSFQRKGYVKVAK